MDERLQRRIQRYGWDKAANAYEGYWHKHLKPAHDRLLDMVRLSRGDSVLDVACGTGLVTLRAAQSVGPDARVVGTDLSDRMIDEARAVAEAAKARSVEFLRMDAESLSFEDRSFDVVLCALGLMYVSNPERAVGEMLRVLRPGGRGAAAVWGERDRCGGSQVFAIVDARVKSEVCPLFFRLGHGEALARAFNDAGFVDVISQRLAITQVMESGEEACLAAFLAGPVALAYDRFDESTRREVHSEYLASLEPYRSGSGYAIPGEFVVVAGTKPAASAW